MEERTMVDSIYIWLEDTKKLTVKPSTYDRLMISLKMLEKTNGRSKVSDWDALYFQNYLNVLAKAQYSESTIKKQYNLIAAHMKYLYAIGEISNPVYLAVSLPKQRKSPRSVEAYSPFEQVKLTKVLDRLEHPAQAVALFMLETGMRIGEVLALTWDDILISKRAVIVSKTLAKMSTKGCRTFVQDGAKTKTSNRKVPLSSKAMKILEHMYQIGYFPDGSHYTYVFGDDEPMSYATVKYYVRKSCEEAGVKYSGLHIFRHTFASNCYSKGADVKLLSKLLGHSDVSITYNTYIHLFGDELEVLRAVVQ